MQCNKCGNEIGENINYCPKCGAQKQVMPTYSVSNNTQANPNTTAEAKASDALGNSIMGKAVDKIKELVSKFMKMNIIAKIVIAVGILLAASIAGIIIWIIFKVVFSSILSVIVVALGGYLVYHRWGAKYFTQRKYDNESKVLEIPKDMNAEALFEALNGKLNYPYFNGIRYGENGECIIKGQYSEYPVLFDNNGGVSLVCHVDYSDKKARIIMLEAITLREYINKFFNPSLPYDAKKNFDALKKAEKHRKTSAIVISIASVLFVAVIAIQYAFPEGLQKITRPGLGVRDAYLTQYSETVTIEDAFDAFFDNAKWSTYEEAGNSYVIFTGVCLMYEERTDVKITFKITGEKFLVDSLEMDGQEKGELMIHSLLTAVYKNY